jgi:hypothetical protein
VSKENIKRYSMDEIRAMLDAGQYFPTAPDAPESEMGDDFWANARRANDSQVSLTLQPDTVTYFRTKSGDPLREMAKVLDDLAKRSIR